MLYGICVVHDAFSKDVELVAIASEPQALALRLARNPELLASVRSKLVRNRETFPLFDTARFTRHIEAAYATTGAPSAR
jgi:predicted O-linked N-acetylglucosamine transferase (SPINDLY family)